MDQEGVPARDEEGEEGKARRWGGGVLLLVVRRSADSDGRRHI